jgi:ribonuclease D
MFEIGSLDSRILVYATYNVIFLFTLAEVLEKRLSRGVQEGKRGYWHCLTE